MKLSLICAISIDGYINKPERGKLNWSSQVDKSWFAQETNRTGVAIMGRTTFETYSEPLPGRLNVVVTYSPEQIAQSEDVWATNLPPAEILAELEKRGYTEVSLVGGSKINRLFLYAGVIDEVWLTLTPHYFGAGVPLFDGGPEIEFELINSKPLGTGELLLHYNVKK